MVGAFAGYYSHTTSTAIQMKAGWRGRRGAIPARQRRGLRERACKLTGSEKPGHMLIRCCDDGTAEGCELGGRDGAERREELFFIRKKEATEGGKQKNEEMWGEMTGSGAVIHLPTARATAENRSNPLV